MAGCPAGEMPNIVAPRTHNGSNTEAIKTPLPDFLNWGKQAANFGIGSG